MNSRFCHVLLVVATKRDPVVFATTIPLVNTRGRKVVRSHFNVHVHVFVKGSYLSSRVLVAALIPLDPLHRAEPFPPHLTVDPFHKNGQFLDIKSLQSQSGHFKIIY